MFYISIKNSHLVENNRSDTELYKSQEIQYKSNFRPFRVQIPKQVKFQTLRS